MNILVFNGSPKGKNGVTVQTMYYLEQKYPQHNYEIMQVGQRIKALEKKFDEVKDAVEKADLIIFAYPVYTFIAPYQLHRFIELLKENNVNFQGKYATQFSTSKHFYDVTAHKYIEENCYDLDAKYSRGLSADMDDLLSDKGQKEACCWFEKLMFDMEHDIHKKIVTPVTLNLKIPYECSIASKEKTGNKDVLILTNVADDDINLTNMIADFKASCNHPVREINIRKYPFSGGCLGCFECAQTGKCIYKDGFDEYLRNTIQTADAIVYAFTIENHFTHSSFKCYDDRQFCNGHRSVTHGMPVGYIISGEYERENNVKTIVEARSEVGGVYLCGVATDENQCVTAKKIEDLSNSLNYALTHEMTKPKDFYGVGGSKIFRDLVWIMQGMMKADHKFYKKTGVYDFPQKQRGRIMQMKLVGAIMGVPSIKKKMKGKMNEYITMPYQKVIDKVKAENQQNK